MQNIKLPQKAPEAIYESVKCKTFLQQHSQVPEHAPESKIQKLLDLKSFSLLHQFINCNHWSASWSSHRSLSGKTLIYRNTPTFNLIQIVCPKYTELKHYLNILLHYIYYVCRALNRSLYLNGFQWATEEKVTGTGKGTDMIVMCFNSIHHFKCLDVPYLDGLVCWPTVHVVTVRGREWTLQVPVMHARQTHLHTCSPMMTQRKNSILMAWKSLNKVLWHVPYLQWPLQ